MNDLKKYMALKMLILLFGSMLLSVSLYSQTTYFSQGTGNFTTLSNWDTDRGGAGTNPSSVNTGGIFIIQNSDIITLDGTALVHQLHIESSGSFLNSTNQITVADSLWILSGGTFDRGTTGKVILGVALTTSPCIVLASANIDLSNVTISQNVTFIGSSTTYNIYGTFEIPSGTAATSITSSSSSFSYQTGSSLKYSNVWTISDEWTSSLTVPNVTLQGGAITIPSGTRTVGTKLTRINGSISGTVAYSASATLEYAPSPAANVTIGSEWPTDGPDNVTINNSGNSVTGSASKRLSKTLTVTAGTIDLGSSSDLTVLGDVVGDVAGSGTIHDNTTLVMGDRSAPLSSTQDQTITGTISLNSLLVNKTGGTNDKVTVSGTINFSASGDITVTNGTLAFTADGKLTLTNLGTLTLTVSSGGIVETGGQGLAAIGTLSATSGTIVFNGSGLSEILPSGFTIGSVEIDNTSNVIIETGTLTISTSLTLTSGLVTTSSSRILSLGTGATISGTPDNTAMIDGPLRKSFASGDQLPFAYPVGFGSSYMPATFNYDANNSAGTSIIEIEAVSGDPGGGIPSGITSVSTDHYYTVNEVGTGGATIDYDITLTHTGTGYTPVSRIKILRQIASGPSYEYDAVNNGTATATTQILSNQTALPDQSNGSIFAFGAISGTVTWTALTGGNWSTGVNWSTGSEPTGSDDVVIDIVDGGTVVLDGGAQKSIKSLILGNGSVNTVTLNITGTNGTPLSIGGSATIFSEGVLTINGTAGGINISGTLNLNSGAEYNISSGSGTVAGARIFNAASITNISSSLSSVLKAASYGILNITSDQSLTGSVTAVDLDVDGAGTELAITGDLTVTGDLSTSNATSTIIVDGTGANFLVTGTTSNTGSITSDGTGTSVFTGTVTSSGGFVITGTSGDVSFGVFTNNGTMTLSNTNTVSFSARYYGTGTVDGSSGNGAISFATFKPVGNVDLTSHTVSTSDTVWILGGVFTPGNTTCTDGLFEIRGSGSISNSSGSITFAGVGNKYLRDFSTALFEFNDLIINTIATVIIYQDVSIVGTLTMLNGNITLGNLDEITLNKSVVGGSSTSYIYLSGTGQVLITGTTSEVTVPLGDLSSPGFMRSIGIIPSNSASVHSVRFYNSASSNGGAVGGGLDHVSDNYYWTVEQTGTAANANVKLHWGPNGTVDDGVNNYATLLVAEWDGVSQWISRGGTSITTSNDSGSVTSTPSFSIAAGIHEFTLGSSAADNSLPVELTSFAAQNGVGGVKLTWSVGSELDNQAFMIERRDKDSGSDFILINEIAGRGTDPSAMEYAYLDESVLNGSVYEYRMRTRDYSGLIHEYGNSIVEIAVEIIPMGFALEQNYPNPFNPTTTIRYSLSEPAKVLLSIYDITGKEIQRLVNNENLETNNYEYTWNAQDRSGRKVSSGVYFYRLVINSGQHILTKKMILVK